jgi:hypothetical protein
MPSEGKNRYSEAKICHTEATDYYPEDKIHHPEGTNYHPEAKKCPSEAKILGLEANFWGLEGKFWGSEAKFWGLEAINLGSEGEIYPSSEPRCPRLRDFPDCGFSLHQRDTPSAFGIHPFPFHAKGNGLIYGVPNLDGEAGYPVKSSLHHEKRINVQTKESISPKIGVHYGYK